MALSIRRQDETRVCNDSARSHTSKDIGQPPPLRCMKPDRILLDNMNPQNLRKAVELAGGKIPLEASGGVSLDTVRKIAESGVDFISVGKITHSAPAADIGADIGYT